jgi:RNA polymerase sigma-54 factor
MAIELKQQVRLSQQLVMTPQLQQAIKLLQLNQLELVGLIQQELQENPVLEEAETEDDTPGEVSDQTPSEQSTAESETPEPIDLSEPQMPEVEPATTDDGPTDAEKIADVEWENYMESNPHTGLETRGGDDDDRRSLEATLTRRPTLVEHLDWQIHLSDFSAEEVELSKWILGNHDDTGYLRATVEDVARQSGAEEELVECVLAKVQKLDPAGVAARDLRECLLIQLRLSPSPDALVSKVVEEYFHLLEKRDFRGLTRALGVSIEEVAAAAAVVASLEPRPGRGFGGDDPIYITPDIYVYKVGDDFHVLLNEDGLPKLRITL